MWRHHSEQTVNLARPGCAPTRALPGVSAEQLSGAIKIMAGKSYWQLADLGDLLRLDTGHFLLVLEAATMLDFAQAHDNTIALTLTGRAFAFADHRMRKHIFAEHLLSRIPLVTDIHHALVTHAEHGISRPPLLRTVARDLGCVEAQRTLITIIDWGRYAGLFSYNDISGLLNLAGCGFPLRLNSSLRFAAAVRRAVGW